MANIKCRWVACLYNTGKVDFIHHRNNDKFGYCSCEEEIVLDESEPCEECDHENDTLICCNFVSKIQKA
jgi:hypothetical protein